MANSVLHGSRAILAIDGAPCGLFTSADYGVNYDAQAIPILGRFGPAEIVITGQEAINVNLRGWRVMDHGPYADGKMLKLQDLLNAVDVTVSLLDRVTGKPIMTVTGCRVTSFSTSTSARAPQELSISLIGLKFTDESGDQGEVGAADLPA